MKKMNSRLVLNVVSLVHHLHQDILVSIRIYRSVYLKKNVEHSDILHFTNHSF